MGAFQDLSGMKFGRLTAIERTDNLGKKTMWKCKCDCGNMHVAPAGDLKNGKVLSCGCLKRELEVNQIEDLTGSRFGWLQVIERAGFQVYPNGDRKVLWKCICDCGNATVSRADYLKSGRKLSCGCMNDGDGLQYHRSLDRLYGVWSSMKGRCNCVTNHEYNYYGGRGIRVCDEWNDSYQSFKEWAMTHGYNPDANKGDCTIDRINVDGDYEPSNCRWVSMKVQSNNKRNSKRAAERAGNTDYVG